MPFNQTHFITSIFLVGAWQLADDELVTGLFTTIYKKFIERDVLEFDIGKMGQWGAFQFLIADF